MSPPSPSAPEERPTEQLPGWLRLLLIGIAVAAGVAIALFPLHFIQKIGIDVPVWEQWEFLPILEKSYSGGPWLREVFQPFFGHMVAVPMLLFIGLSRLNGWNVMLEMYWGWLLVLGTGLLLARWLRPLRLPLVIKVVFWLCLALLVFELRASELTLNGLNSGVFLCYFLVVASIELGRESQASWPRFLAMAVTGLLATWSWGAGLLIWPVGLLLLLHHARGRWSRSAIWCAVAVVAASPYVIFKVDAGVAGQHDLSRMPRWFLNLLSAPFSTEARTIPAALLVPLAVAAVVVVARKALRARAIPSEMLPWAALLSHGVLTILLILYMRSVSPAFSPAFSRYAFVAVFPLVGFLGVGLLAVREVTEKTSVWLRRAAWGASAAVLLIVGGRTAFMSYQVYEMVSSWQPVRAALDTFMRRAPEYATEGQFLAVVQMREDLLEAGLPMLKRWHLGPYRRASGAPLLPLEEWLARGTQAEDLELGVSHSVQMGEDHLDIWGWAVDRQGSQPAEFVAASAEGKILEQALTELGSSPGAPGTDPARNIYGWRMVIPATKLRALGDPRKLELVAFTKDGRTRRIPLPLPEGLRVAATSP